MSYIIEIKNLTKKYMSEYSQTVALDNIDFRLKKGESCAIVGPSGSGKTTLLQILGGLDNATSGQIIIDGQDLSKMSDKDLSKFRNSTIGFVFQFFNLQEYLTAKENVMLPGMIAKQNPKVLEKRAEELLKKVGLENETNKLVNHLSGGQMQRVAIARALINQPKIILADEATGALDAENAQLVLDIFEEIQKEGVSVIMITHDNNIAKKFKNIVNINKAKIIK